MDKQRIPQVVQQELLASFDGFEYECNRFIQRSTPEEVFDAWLRWEGINGYSELIWNAVTSMARS